MILGHANHRLKNDLLYLQVISQNELKGIVKGKVKNKDGKFVEKEYIKLKNLENGRSLVVDSNGKQWVRAHDGVILKS